MSEENNDAPEADLPDDAISLLQMIVVELQDANRALSDLVKGEANDGLEGRFEELKELVESIHEMIEFGPSGKPDRKG